MSADEWRIRSMVEAQISRKCKKRGRKPNPQKLTEIIMSIWVNDAISLDPLKTKEIGYRLPKIKENDLEDLLAFLRMFPSSNPWLLVGKRSSIKHGRGAPANTYKINPVYRARSSYLGLTAQICLEKDE